jgi:D-alanyl-lipoteichoic acid acyltransferase DltB (MBOAT superfamily)
MSFVSFSFLLLFTVVFLIRQSVGRKGNEPLFLISLLFASMLFYAWHVPIYILIILFSTFVDYSAGFYLGTQDASASRRKAVLTVSLVANLGMLAIFKYSNFFLTEVQWIFMALGWRIEPRTLSLVLPMGISFYTFQSMSYTIDVYRGVIRPISSFWRFLFFVSFFPQLVAGPIVRARDFLYQIDRRRSVNMLAFCEGGYLLIRGFFLKVAIADNVGIVVDEYWAQAGLDGAGSLLGISVAVLFSFQIFCDFAGYSSIARGLAYLLGFRLPLNFNSPYIAGSFSEFWRRWHITLSRWLRDYLYVPLGGNRKGKMRTLVNVMLTMLLGGLWHGPAFTFVIWGGIHGLALTIERVLGLRDLSQRSRFVKVGWFVVVQSIVLLAWVFFRSADTAQAGGIIANICSFDFAPTEGFPLIECMILVSPAIAMHIRAFFIERFESLRPRAMEQAIAAAAMAYLTITCFGANNAFIYFQF